MYNCADFFDRLYLQMKNSDTFALRFEEKTWLQNKTKKFNSIQDSLYLH